ncbi:ABC transporter G family member 20-like [Solenopsis invicta]|uniref:ABC transporter G family member 20-like n=1 Tax=Solenopsis invicta TaxID=13686 RepID=UPI00193D0866|nr:ABC transporter G family member 20-like [Solenopsis invicta]XP_039314464.1 ABC transporter G family member 20-like [Solenopsis invicta]
MMQKEAVVVRKAIMHYGKKQVLNGLNMTISRGTIYGLLGASGCGKTTMLSCIVGIRYFDSGELWVLGGTPGNKDFGIPGPRVGYMPQDIALVKEFSVSNAFYYFGRINGLDDKEIEAKLTFFSKLLQLPPLNHLVKNMSGGEQRRVSFASALIHNPELLILDEPTVGLDPNLRKDIWDYLKKLTQEKGVTVLISTHYIHETAEANKIGLMRHGKLLAESAPCDLLTQFHCMSLEDVFLKLCKEQNKANERYRRLSEVTSNNVLYQDRYRPTEGISECKTNPKRHVSRLKRLKALLSKNGIHFLRNYPSLILAIWISIFQAILYVMAFGEDPKGINIGIVNKEAGNCEFNSNYSKVWNDGKTCHFVNLSCRFLHSFDNSIAKKEYVDFSEAKFDVKNRKLYGATYFNQNFSESLQKRLEEGNFVSDSVLYGSEIQVYLDMSDGVIGPIIQKKLLDCFTKFFEDVMRDCGYSTKLANLPIIFEDPVYGRNDSNYKDFTIPSSILSFAFFLAIALSTNLINSDRLEGIWDRSIAQGVRTEEILLSHILIQSFIVVIHTILLMLIFFGWRVDCKGSIFVVILLVFLNGFCGLMCGFVISVLCNNYMMSGFCTTGSFVLLLVLNGSFWPLEGMPKFLRWFSNATPITLSSTSIRAIIYKGSSIIEWQVLIGFFTSLGWISFCLLLTILYLRWEVS